MIHTKKSLPLFGAVAFATLTLAFPEPSVAQKPKPSKPTIEFNRDVRAILSKCFTCHGADPKTRAANLRLDQREGAVKSGAIVPGDPAKSNIIFRIETKDEGMRMPPSFTHKSISTDELKTLKQWIKEGANYKEHWAFVTPVRSTPPTVKQASWPLNPIDNFILAKQEAVGLMPSPVASKETLIRRVTLDITGLPPTPAEVDAFLTDKSPKAYEKVVDRLLASPRYGERMAMDWMDYARYADSNGYQADYERFQWRWRDWVIDAFNKNMPYDQFTVEQLAGDMLPNATLDQKIATGFNRNHRINTEGGVIAEEWRVETVIDRVETTSAVWLGLTSGCARCHDHKYDPLSQKEFYRLFAFFNNVPESGTGDERPVNHPPFIEAPSNSQLRMIKELTAKTQALDASIEKRAVANVPKAEAWSKTAVAPTTGLTGPATRYAFGAPSFLLKGTASLPKAEGSASFVAGRSSGAVRTDGSGYVDLGSAGDIEKDKPYSVAVWLNPEVNSGSPVARMDDQHDFRGWDIMLQDGRPAFHLISKWSEDALKVIGKTQLPMKQWSHVVVTYDGSAKAAGVRIFVNGKLVEQDVERDVLRGPLNANVGLYVGRRFKTSMYTGLVDDLVLAPRVLAESEITALASVKANEALLTVPVAERTSAIRTALARLWSTENDPAFKAETQAREDAGKLLARTKSEITSVMVMEEMPKPRTAYVLERGQYDHRGEAVTAGVPRVLPGLPKGAPKNRLGFAKWVVSPTNPLTARVTVNRLWDRFFGIGIVETVEDFGTRAEFPSHPALLDWLATEFTGSKWDMKHMIRLIVTSATYKQSSHVLPIHVKKDPTNRLLARGPRLRLAAEVIRDQALSVAGLLREQVGGKSVRPYQPEGIWDETNVYGNLRNYKNDVDGNQYRRSLYTIWKRTAAPPGMTLFDASTRETCRVRRARTNTPLQALVLLNDETFIESARMLAERVIREGGPDPAARVTRAFRLVLGRKPSAKEVKILEAGLAARLREFRQKPDRAKGLLAIGETKANPKLNPAELAAYTLTASTIMNLDEAVTKE